MGRPARDRKLAILGFHKIGAPSSGAEPSWWYVPEETFVGHIEFLREDGWEVIGLAALLRGLAAPDSLPERGALLTFDDGYRSIREVALPWLLRFGYPAVLFVPTGFIGGRNDFDAGIEPQESICDWHDLRELERAGVSVQSHGISHRRLSWLDVAEQEQEVVASKTILEQALGKPVDVFAHPYGDEGADPGALRELFKRAGYRAACLYGGGPNPLPISDPYRLARLAMGPDSDLGEMLGRCGEASDGR